MEEREGRRNRERKRWRERNRGQDAQIRRQSGVISRGEDFKNNWAD